MACAGRDPGAEAAASDTATTAITAAAQSVPEADDPPVELLSPEIRRACASAAEYWRPYPGVTARRFDSTLTRPRGIAMADACWVVIRLEDDPVRSPELRVPFVAAGWLPLYEFDADGKDGRSRVYQLDPVRCYIEERWDGGTDADTTSVPASWFEQRVACYRRQ